MSPFYPTLTLTEALARALERTAPLQRREPLAVREALGRVLARGVDSPEDLPGFDRSGMDGYAVRAADTYAARESQPSKLRLAGRVEMGQDVSGWPPLEPGQAREISTGGMLPPGADAVVILEEVELEADTLRVFKPVAPGAHVVRRDEDLRRGQPVLRAGRALRPQDLGALLGVGLTRVEVFSALRVGILATGDEVIPPERSPRPGQVRDINSTTTAAQVQELGLVPIFYGIVPDQPQQLADAVTQALAECDAVLLSGGSSVGVRDAAVEVLAGLGEVLVHGIRIAPGKPTILALCGDKPAIGLPGNPASSLVVVEKFATPILLKRSGRADWRRGRPWVRARLTQNVPSARGRDDFVRVRLVERDGESWAEPIHAHSNNISSLSSADGLLPIPADCEGLPQGAKVSVERW